MIKAFKRGLDPDFLFIEPYELVVTKEIRTAASMALRDVTYELGPFITLVDGPTFEFSWHERKRLILNHVVDADLVAISRTDLLETEQVQKIRNTLKDHVGNNHVLRLSISLNRGVKEVIAKILGKGTWQPV